MAFTAKTDWKDGDKLPAAEVNRIEAGIAEKAAKGDKGDPGEPGVTPHVGENGNWFVGDTDTGVRAQGEKGDPGSDAANPFTPEEVTALKALAADAVTP